MARLMHEELLFGLQNEINKSENANKQDYFVFDSDGHTLWIIWYGDEI